jgi:hypothetical protein
MPLGLLEGGESEQVTVQRTHTNQQQKRSEAQAQEEG